MGPGHGPFHPCSTTLRREAEVGHVVGLERLDEVELDQDALRVRFPDFHPALAGLLAGPAVDRAYALVWSREALLHLAWASILSHGDHSVQR